MNYRVLMGCGAAVLLLLTVTGCTASGEDEALRQWMAEQRAAAKPQVTPITEPKRFEPQDYIADTGIEPFNPLKLLQVLRRDTESQVSNAALIAPELARRFHAQLMARLPGLPALAEDTGGEQLGLL